MVETKKCSTKKIKLLAIIALLALGFSLVASYKIEVKKLEKDLQEKYDKESSDILYYLSNDITKAMSFLKVLINKNDIQPFKGRDNLPHKIKFEIIKDYSLTLNKNKKIFLEGISLEVKRYGNEDYIQVREVKDNKNLSLEFSLTSLLKRINKSDYYVINKKINFSKIKPENNHNYYTSYAQLSNSYYLTIQEKKQDLDKGIVFIQKKHLLYLIEFTVGAVFLITLLILLYSIISKKKSDSKTEKQNNILKNKDEKIIILEQKVNKLEEESDLIKKSYGQYRVLTISLNEELKKALITILLQNAHLDKDVGEVFAEMFKENELIAVDFHEVVDNSIGLCKYHIMQNKLILNKSIRVAQEVSVNIPRFVFLLCFNSIFWNFFCYAKYGSAISIVVNDNKSNVSLILSSNTIISLPTKRKKDIFMTISNVKKYIAMYECKMEIDDEKGMKKIKLTIPKSFKQAMEKGNVFTAQTSNAFN